MSSRFVREAPVIQKSYVIISPATSQAQKPAVQQQSEPKKGIMDYVLTTVDAVLDT